MLALLCASVLPPMMRHAFSRDLIDGECELCGAPIDAPMHDLEKLDMDYQYGLEYDADFPRTFGALRRQTPKDT